jgi:hypothetical protein
LLRSFCYMRRMFLKRFSSLLFLIALNVQAAEVFDGTARLFELWKPDLLRIQIEGISAYNFYILLPGKGRPNLEIPKDFEGVEVPEQYRNFDSMKVFSKGKKVSCDHMIFTKDGKDSHWYRCWVNITTDGETVIPLLLSAKKLLAEGKSKFFAMTKPGEYSFYVSGDPAKVFYQKFSKLSEFDAHTTEEYADKELMAYVKWGKNFSSNRLIFNDRKTPDFFHWWLVTDLDADIHNLVDDDKVKSK